MYGMHPSISHVLLAECIHMNILFDRTYTEAIFPFLYPLNFMFDEPSFDISNELMIVISDMNLSLKY